MKILGVDCSSKSIGCVQLEEDLLKSAMLYGGDKNDFETRLKRMFYLIRDLLHEWEPDIVYIEQAVYLQNVKTTLMIARVIDMVIFHCLNNGISYQVVDNRSWKKSVLGNGKASKEQIMEFAKARFEPGTQDLADAFAIAIYGKMRLG